MTDPETSSSLWQKLAPFLDLIGAVLIFGSWIATNTFSQHAASEANRHQAIIDRVRQFRVYDEFSRRLNEVQSDLTLTLYHLRKADDDHSRVTYVPSWTGMTANHAREVNEFVDDLHSYAEALSVSEPIKQTVESIQTNKEELLSAFQSGHERYDQLRENIRSEQGATPAVHKEMEELLQQNHQLWMDYAVTKERMLNVGDDLLRNAADKSSAANQSAEKFKKLSYLLYAVGTLIVLIGRIQSTLSKPKEK